MALFALDHNYPAPIIEQAKPFLSNVELVFIGEIDSRLTEFDDWECCSLCITTRATGTG